MKDPRVSKLQAKLAELVETTTGAEGAALIDIGTGMTLAQAGMTIASTRMPVMSPSTMLIFTQPA